MGRSSLFLPTGGRSNTFFRRIPTRRSNRIGRRMKFLFALLYLLVVTATGEATNETALSQADHDSELYKLIKNIINEQIEPKIAALEKTVKQASFGCYTGEHLLRNTGQSIQSEFNVNFPKAFKSAPKVFASLNSMWTGGYAHAYVYFMDLSKITPPGCNVHLTLPPATSSTHARVGWLACG